MTAQPASVSVTLPVSQAIDRVKRVLFQPFDPGKWFVIGFCAWLARLGEGGGFNSHAPGGVGHHGGGGNFRHELEHAKEVVLNNLYWIVPVAIAVAILCLALWLLFTWLSSRGRFMFLHCVALDRAEVVAPWRKFAREGNSLFGFRIVLGLIGLTLMLPPLAMAGIITFRMAERGELDVGGILRLIGLALVFVAVGILFFLIGKFTTDFVVPIMFLRGNKCRQGWGELLGLLSAHIGHFVLYLLFQVVLGIAIGALVLVVVIATCCCAGCLIAIPYLGTVLLLPILVFKRAYSLHYLAQFGRDYDVFTPSPTPTPGMAAPLM